MDCRDSVEGRIAHTQAASTTAMATMQLVRGRLIVDVDVGVDVAVDMEVDVDEG